MGVGGGDGCMVACGPWSGLHAPLPKEGIGGVMLPRHLRPEASVDVGTLLSERKIEWFEESISLSFSTLCENQTVEAFQELEKLFAKGR